MPGVTYSDERETPTSVAVVTVARGRHDHLRLQRRGLAAGSRRPRHHVLVSMGDPVLDRWGDAHGPPVDVVRLDVAADAALPLARARNAGVARALEHGADVVVLLDVDCVPAPDLVRGYVQAALARPDALLCGPVAYLPPPGPGGYALAGLADLARPHPARPAPAPGELLEDRERHELFWSLSFAVTPRLWERLGGFDEGYVGYGGEDTDLAFRARSLDVPLVWVGTARASHQHHPVSDPPVEHVADVLRNGARFADRWGVWPMQGWLDAFVGRGLARRTRDGGYAPVTEP